MKHFLGLVFAITIFFGTLTSRLMANKEHFYIVCLGQLVPQEKSHQFSNKFSYVVCKSLKNSENEPLQGKDNFKTLFLHKGENPEYYVSAHAIIQNLAQVCVGSHNIPEYKQVFAYAQAQQNNPNRTISVDLKDGVCKLGDLHAAYAELIELRCRESGKNRLPLIAFTITEEEIKLNLIPHPYDQPNYPTCGCMDPAIWFLSCPSSRGCDKFCYNTSKELDATCGTWIHELFESISQMGWCFDSVPLGTAGCCCYTCAMCLKICGPA